MIQAAFDRLIVLLKHESAANIFWQFFEKFITLSISFIVSIYLIRYLGPTQYGIFSYSISYILLFSTIANIGLQNIVIREISRGGVKAELIIGSAFILMLCGSILAAVFALSGILIAKDPVLVLIIIGFGCLTSIVTSFNVINYCLMANLKSRYTSYVVIGQKTVEGCGMLILIHYKCSLIAISAALFIEAIISYAILYLIYAKISNFAKWQFKFSVAKFLFKESFPLAISGSVMNLYMRLDQVMLKHFCGLSAVGVYNVGIKLSELLYLLPGILSINILPLMVKRYDMSPAKFNSFMIKLYRLFFYSSLILAIGFFLVAQPLVNLLYGSQYALSGSVFKYGVLSIIAAFIGVINHLWLQIKGLQHYLIYTTACGLICCFLLNLILIPLYGVIGAVWVMVITQMTASVFAFILFADTRECFKLFICAVGFKSKVSKYI